MSRILAVLFLLAIPSLARAPAALIADPDSRTAISLVGLNEYIGWYGNKKAEDADDTRWTFAYQKPVNMLSHMAPLAGMSPWILMDFRSPRRSLPGIQDYFNRNGLPLSPPLLAGNSGLLQPQRIDLRARPAQACVLYSPEVLSRKSGHAIILRVSFGSCSAEFLYNVFMSEKKTVRLTETVKAAG